jgi:hypothetical protein
MDAHGFYRRSGPDYLFFGASEEANSGPVLKAARLSTKL